MCDDIIKPLANISPVRTGNFLVEQRFSEKETKLWANDKIWHLYFIFVYWSEMKHQAINSPLREARRDSSDEERIPSEPRRELR